MDTSTQSKPSRRPRFRRAKEPPPFRLTPDDVAMIRELARHRFLQSNHIAALAGRSPDRVNDRLMRLFHAGYVDRPRAQLDYYATKGSSPMVYALADRGARLLAEHGGTAIANVEWTRKNRSAGRPFIEHQLQIIDFHVALRLATKTRSDVRLIDPDAIAAEMREPPGARNPFSMKVRLSHEGRAHDIAVIPDFVFGLRFADGSRRCFMVEIDRGTMPVVRSDFAQTSYDRKMRAYLAAHAGKHHERRFGWKTFRVLTVTTDERRMRSMSEALRRIHLPNSLGPSLFLFATRAELRAADPLAHPWLDGAGRPTRLI